MDLIRLANTNAREETERATDRAARQSKLMEELGRMLRLPHPPHRIEAYDISNTGKDDMVAAMTVFLDGRPLKRDHRHFKLRDMDGPDDYAAMEQVLTRRFRRYLDGDEKFSMLPDALFIDGGAVHAGVALSVLKKMGLAIPVFGMVKDNRHRTRALVTPGGEEIGIRRDPALFALVGQIQEETHRFAIQFNRLQRKKRMQASQLDSIPGVGPKRKAALLRHFKSITAIRTASLDALSHVVDKSTAQAVLDHFSAQQKGDTPCESSQEVPEDES
jgi:excinuclease ABC subunit C